MNIRLLVALAFTTSACGPVPATPVAFDPSAPPTPVDAGTQQPEPPQPAPDAGTREVGQPAEPDIGNEPEPVEAPDYADRGQVAVESEQLQVRATEQCTMTAVRFRPNTPVVRGYALFLHGFSRGRSQFLGWGEHLASHGIEAVVSDLCHASVAGVDPLAGGAAIDILIDNIGGAPVVIVGHSAGSMAALVAGAENDSTVGVLGLDPVAPREGNLNDQAAALEGMLAALVGAPSQCNSSNSGVEIYREGSADMFTITGATHCDFEAPTNFICTATCGGSAGEGAQSAIRQLTTSYVAWKLGLDGAALWWDEESNALSSLIREGKVELLR